MSDARAIPIDAERTGDDRVLREERESGTTVAGEEAYRAACRCGQTYTLPRSWRNTICDRCGRTLPGQFAAREWSHADLRRVLGDLRSAVTLTGPLADDPQYTQAQQDEMDALLQALSVAFPSADDPSGAPLDALMAVQRYEPAGGLMLPVPSGSWVTYEAASHAVQHVLLVALLDAHLDAIQAQTDVADLLRALGLPDHTRPASPHRVVQEEALPAIRALREHAAQMEGQRDHARFVADKKHEHVLKLEAALDAARAAEVHDAE